MLQANTHTRDAAMQGCMMHDPQSKTCTLLEKRAELTAGGMPAHLLCLVALVLCYTRLWNTHAPLVLSVAFPRPLILVSGALSCSLGIHFSHMIPVPVGHQQASEARHHGKAG